MEPVYDHKKYEAEIYKKWEDSGAFSPKQSNSSAVKQFSIIMPPPNANDPLHIGHARFIAIEDALIRYHRMKGEPTLWLPGSDHAGIETQYVFEKKLREKGKSRFDCDRDTLYKMIWNYVQENTGVMESQLKKLGASCDWTRFKFTLDPEIVKIVYKTFKKLYDDGLIYRGKRIVNYCPRCGTNYSQLEIDTIEKDDNLYYLDYGTITIATTRPETIFADVAVAVNPKDKRYKKLIGINAKIPLINREVPVIMDNHVDVNFGTGALKITPAHDPTDFEIGQSHHLPLISVIDEKGKMTGTPEKYVGMKVEVARSEVVKDLQTVGKIVKIEKIHHTAGTCYRDHGIIEPRVAEQWFLKIEPLAKKALLSIKSRDVKFAAKRYEKIAKHWLSILYDWNISRQIVWGIRIPAWRCEKCLEWTVTDGAEPVECPICHNGILKQDDDTFDTWFSSSQWPFVTLQTSHEGDFEKFYPTSVMETAYDILPIWVLKMIMFGLYVTGKVPFEEVLIHGLVRDRDGQKISKSKGNVINPIEMAEKYGADALRMGLLWGALVENDVALSEENINAQRKFANKVWNIGRFVEISFDGISSLSFDKPKNLDHEERLILEECSKLIKSVTKNLDRYKLNECTEEIYNFTWHNFADKFIEISKEKIKNKDVKILWTLRHVYIQLLKLLHPFMPFLTEILWQQIPDRFEHLLITSEWPRA